MANEEQLAILLQGVEVWNKWMEENPYFEADLSEANLTGADLSGVNLSRANLSKANLLGANLQSANLHRADLNGANLWSASLKQADLSEAWLEGGTDLSVADLSDTNLRETRLTDAELFDAFLDNANLFKAILWETDLSHARLSGANLWGAFLKGSNFSKASLSRTIIGNSDLSEVIGLEEVDHVGPSTIGTDAIAQSKGKIPETFLRGCGLSDWEIESAKLYNPDLSHEEINKILYKMYDLRASQALQISPLFISYSHADGKFVDKLENYLNNKGIRFWRDVHDMKSGRIETQIDQAMRLNPTVLLILSEQSLKSDWVEHEVRTARELEKEMGRDVLCPVALDDSWKDSPWPKRVMERVMEYNILDFSNWKDDSKFGSTFNKLIDGLELFYKG